MGNQIRTKSGLLLATDCIRIVHGERGSYVEIAPHQIIKSNIRNPFHNPNTFGDAYYIQYRSADSCNIKIYHQKRTVKYADYKIGLFYVSIEDIVNSHIGLNKFL